MKKQPEQAVAGTVSDLGKKVKEKYPGVYDDMPDDELGRKIKAKYPDAYADFSDPPTAPAPPAEQPAPPEPGKPQAPPAPASGSGAQPTGPVMQQEPLLPPSAPATEPVQQSDVPQVPVFTPGTEQFATKSPLLPSQKPDASVPLPDAVDAGSFKMKKVGEDPAKRQEFLAKQDEANKQASYYMAEYAGLDQKALDERKALLQKSAMAINAMGSEFEATNKRLEQKAQALEQKRNMISSMITDEEAFKVAAAAYEQEVNAFNREVKAIGIQQDLLKDMGRKAQMDQDAIVRREFDIKAGVGNRPAGMAYSILNSAGKALSGTLEVAGKVIPSDQQILEAVGLAPKGTAAKAQEDWKQYLKDVENAPTALTGIDQFVTPEYIQRRKEESLFDAGLFTLSEMAPAVAMSIVGGTPAMAATFFSSSYRDMGNEMQGEYWDLVPEAEKEAIRIGVATVSAGLSTMGLQALAGRIPIVNDIFFKAAQKMLPNMTAGQVRRIIDAETKSYVTNLMSKTAQGIVLEGPEEGVDYLSEEAVKTLYENYKRSEFGDKADTLFNNAETLNELGKGLWENMTVGAVAGSMMGAGLAAVSSVGARERLTDKEFKAFSAIIADGSLKRDFESQVAADLESGKIDRAEYDKLIDNLNTAQSIVEQIPEDMSIKATREAYDLLEEKAKLKKKDKALVGDRIAKIDEKLAALAGTTVDTKEEVSDKEPEPQAEPQAEEPTTPKTPPITPVPDQPKVEVEWEGDDVRPTKTIDDARALQGRIVDYQGESGYIDIDEGGKVTFTSVSGKKVVEVPENKAGSLDLLNDIEPVEVENVVNEDGSVSIYGQTYTGDIAASTVLDEAGDVVSVTLNNSEGQPRTFRGDAAAQIVYENTLRQASSQPGVVEQIETNLTTNEQVQQLIEQERGKQKRRILERKRKGRKRTARTATAGQAEGAARSDEGWTKQEADELAGLIEQEELDTIEQKMEEFFQANKKHFKAGPNGERVLKGNAPNGVKRQWADMRDTLGYKNILKAEQDAAAGTESSVQGGTAVGELPLGPAGGAAVQERTAGIEQVGGDAQDAQGVPATQPEAPTDQVSPAGVPDERTEVAQGVAPMAVREQNAISDMIDAISEVGEMTKEEASMVYEHYRKNNLFDTRDAFVGGKLRVKDGRLFEKAPLRKALEIASKATRPAEGPVRPEAKLDTYVPASLTTDIKDDAQAIADAYVREYNEHNSDKNPDHTMYVALAGSVDGASYNRFGDKNKRTNGMAKTYFAGGRKKKWGLDQIAQDLSESLGREVDPGELAAFMEAYPDGLPRRNARLKELTERYKGITGKELNIAGAKSILNKGKSWTPEEQAIVDEAKAQGLTVEDIAEEDIETAQDEVSSMEDDDLWEFLTPSSKGKTNIKREKSQQDEQPKEADDTSPKKGGGEDVRSQEGGTTRQAEEGKREQAEDQWDEEYKVLSEAVDKAYAAMNKAIADFNNRGQALFDENEGSVAAVIESDRKVEREDFDRIVGPLKDRYEAAKKERQAFRDSREKWIDDRAKELASQGDLFAVPSQEEGTGTEEDGGQEEGLTDEQIRDLDRLTGLGDTDGPVEQKGSSRPIKTGRPRTDRVVAALRSIAPGLRVYAPKTVAEYAKLVEKVGQGLASTWGIYDPRTNELFLNPNSPDLKQTLMHEAAHPLIIALAKNNTELFVKFYDQVRSERGGKYVKFAQENYGNQSEAAQMAEALAEFLGDVAAGDVPVSVKPDSLWQKFKAFIQDIMAALGWDTRSIDLSKPKDVREFAAQFKKAMDKGIKITGFDPVGQSGQAMMQQDADRLVDGWYSRLDQAVVAKGNTQSGADWMKWAEARAKEGALSMEEAKWTGLSNWLTSKGNEKVTPQQVREFLSENRVKVEVKVLGDKVSDEVVAKWWNDQYAEKHPNLEWSKLNERQQDQARIDYAGETDQRDNRTKFSQYQLPGGTNYREVLVKLPHIGQMYVAVLSADGEIISRHGTFEEAENAIALGGNQVIAVVDSRGNIIDEDQEGKRNADFHSSHFDEPNILVHLRLNDRTGPNGEKVLFVEELQSDWGQKGKKEGFNTNDQLQAKKDELFKEYAEIQAEAERRGLPTMPSQSEFDRFMDANPDLKQRRAENIRRGAAAESEYRIGPTPSAPFVTSTDAWVELGLKQAIRMAVEGGYDKIAWTTGEQQNERYDLSKTVDEVRYNPDTEELKIWTKTDNGPPSIVETVSPDKLDDFIGKEAAERLLQQPLDEETESHVLDGEGLKVGGSGMKGFYDKILPTVAKKVSKKLNGNGVVSDTVIGEDKQVGDEIGRQQSIAITPEMVASVSAGVPLMQKPDGSKLAEMFKQQGLTALQAQKYMEMRGVDPDVIKAVVKAMGGIRPSTKKAQQQVKKATGQTQPVQKVTVNVKTALKDQLRNAARAAREAKADVSAKRKEFAKQVGEMIKNDLFGRIAPRQANALITAAARTNPDSPKAVARFFDYAQRVIADANYAEALDSAREARKKARTLKGRKGIPNNLAVVLARMAAIDVRLLPDPAEFAAKAADFLRAFDKPGTDKYKMAASDAMNEYLIDLESKLAKEEEVDAKKQFVDLINEMRGAGPANMMNLDPEEMSPTQRKMYEALKKLDPDKLFDALNDADPDKKIAELMENMAEEVQEAARLSMVALAENSRADLADMDTTGMTPKQKRAYNALMNVDLNAMSIKDLGSYIFGVDNLVENESFDALMSVSLTAQAYIDTQKIAQLNEEKPFRTAWPTGWTKGVREAFRQMFYGATNTFARLTGYTSALGDLSKLVGLADIQMGKASADRSVRIEDEALSKFIAKKVREGRSKGRRVHSVRNRLAEGMIGFMLQEVPGYSAEKSFDIRKNIMRQDIERNAEDNPSEYVLIKELFDTFVADATTTDEMMAKFKAEMPENHDIVNYLIEMNAKYTDEIMEHNAMLRNQVDTPRKNYLTLTYKLAEGINEADKKKAREAGEDGYKADYGAFGSSLSKPKQAGKMRSASSATNLMAGRRIDYNLRRNSMQALSDNLYDARTSEHWQKAYTMMRTPGINDAMGGKNNAKAIDNAMADVYNSHTSNVVDDKMGGRFADWVAQKIKNLASFWGMAGVGQFIQQAADQMTMAFMMSFTKDGGKSYGQSAVDVMDMMFGRNELRELINLGSIGERGELLAGTRWSRELKSAMSNLETKIQQSATLQAVNDAQEALGRTWFWALKNSDQVSATTAWVEFYRQYLDSKGQKVKGWGEEAQLVRSNDDVRKAAFAYAEQMTNLTQGASDPAMFGAWARRSRSGWMNLGRAAMNPFGGFQSGVHGRLAGSWSEISANIGSSLSDTEARDRTIAAARVIASTAIAQATYQYAKYKIVAAMLSGGAVLLREAITEAFGDDDDDKWMQKLAFVGELMFTARVIDRDINRMIQEAAKESRNRKLLGPLYDEEEVKRKKAAENFKIGVTQWALGMSVSGFTQLLDRQVVDAVNWAYWSTLSMLRDPDVLRKDGTVIPYDDWKADTRNTPIARGAQWDDSMSMGMFDIVAGRASRVIKSADKAFSGISDEEMKKAVSGVVREKDLATAKAFNSMVWQRRNSKDVQDKKAIDKQFDKWVRTQPPEDRERLFNQWVESIITPNEPFVIMVKGQSKPEVQAAMYMMKSQAMDEDEKRKLFNDLSVAGVVDDGFMLELSKLQKMNAKR